MLAKPEAGERRKKEIRLLSNAVWNWSRKKGHCGCTPSPAIPWSRAKEIAEGIYLLGFRINAEVALEQRAVLEAMTEYLHGFPDYNETESYEFNRSRELAEWALRYDDWERFDDPALLREALTPDEPSPEAMKVLELVSKDIGERQFPAEGQIMPEAETPLLRRV